MKPLDLTFGQLEASLASMHGVADEKRTAFQARLKNFHRLRFPLQFETSKGKTAKYQPGHAAEMALAVEMTQLGLPPERTVRVLALNWYPAAMAISMAARALSEQPGGFDELEVKESDPLSMFLFFDPAALTPLMFDYDPKLTPDLDQASDTFFYGGAGVVRDSLVRATSGAVSRISLVNVTAMLDQLAGDPYPDDLAKSLAWRVAFFEALAEWASDRSEGVPAAPEVQRDFIFRFASAYFLPPTNDADFNRMSDLFDEYFGLPEDAVREGLQDFVSERVGRASNPEA